MARITLTLEPKEKAALLKLAESEFRDPRMQAALIIRKELERKKYLSPGAAPVTRGDSASKV